MLINKVTPLFLTALLYSGSKGTNQRPAFCPLLPADRNAPMSVEYFGKGVIKAAALSTSFSLLKDGSYKADST